MALAKAAAQGVVEMGMLVIEGNFRALGAQPDGDSVRFYPTDPDHWKLLPGPHKIRVNRQGGAQTRFDGVDALETHYPAAGGFGIVHQPLQFGHQAAEEVLAWLGFTNVVRDAKETVTASTPEQRLGYLLSRNVDRNGRCVAFLFRGPAPTSSGEEVFFDDQLLKQSLNYHLLERGLAYPTYYSKLFYDIRDEMTAAVQLARQAGRGLWAADVTNAGFVLEDIQTLEDQVVILPKLFRRLIDYLAINDGSSSLAGFKPYLAARDDRMYIISTGHSTGFDFVVHTNDQQVQLSQPPEDLVFLEA